MEINPDHPMTKAMHDQWHKIAVLLMMKLKQRHIEISASDIEKLIASESSTVVVQTKGDKIILDLVSEAEGKRILKQQGGQSH